MWNWRNAWIGESIDLLNGWIVGCLMEFERSMVVMHLELGVVDSWDCWEELATLHHQDELQRWKERRTSLNKLEADYPRISQRYLFDPESLIMVSYLFMWSMCILLIIKNSQYFHSIRIRRLYFRFFALLVIIGQSVANQHLFTFPPKLPMSHLARNLQGYTPWSVACFSVLTKPASLPILVGWLAIHAHSTFHAHTRTHTTVLDINNTRH